MPGGSHDILLLLVPYLWCRIVSSFVGNFIIVRNCMEDIH